MSFEDRRGQLLRILPKDIRREVFRNLKDFKVIEDIGEWLRIQAELEDQWDTEDSASRRRGPGLHAFEDEVTETSGEAPDEDDMQALLALGPDATEAEILAVQQRFRKFGARPRLGGGGPTPRPPPRPSDRQPRLPGAAASEVKCINCGKTGHEARNCRAPVLAKHERPCWM